MRRTTAVLALFLLLAPAAGRLAAASRDAESARCAIACARAMRTQTGAVCCPAGHGDAGATLSSCQRDEAVSPASAGPMLPPWVVRLEPPSWAARHEIFERLALPASHSRAPDKVPLLLG